MSTQVTGLRFGFQSHKGPRDTNEDTVLSVRLPDGRWLLAVADGMGGLAEGEQASKVALSSVYQELSEGSTLWAAVEKGNEAVLEEGANQDMGTTLVAAVFEGDRAQIVNVGDSRAYHLDPLGLLQITEDHTMGRDALREGTLTEAEAASSPMADALSRYLGSGDGVNPDLFGPFHINERGWLLLCSDGLYRVFDLKELETILLEESDPEVAAERLVQEALNRGTSDNVSVALAFRPGTPHRVPLGLKTNGSNSLSKTMMPGRKTHRRHSRHRHRKRRWARVAMLVGIPSLIGVVFALWWWLGSG
jgi:protein phosphatase